MLLSFSPTSPTDYATGDHLRGYPDLVGFDVSDYSPETHTYSIEEVDGEWQLVTTPIPIPPETPTAKHSRIRNTIVTSTSLVNLDIEGETFSDREIGDIIVDRVFSGNPHAQMALTAKLQSMIIDGTTNEELVAQANVIRGKINEVRNLFNLGNI